MAAVAATAGSGQVSAIYQAAYHNLFESLATAIWVGCIFTALFVGIVGLGIRVKRPDWMFQALAGLIWIFLVFKIVRAEFPPFPLPPAGKLAFIASSLIFVAVGVRWIPLRQWAVASKAVVVGAILWSVVPMGLALTTKLITSTTPIPTFDMSSLVSPTPRGTVIVVLDETSPEVANSLLANLPQREGQLVHQGESQRAGKDTINAIPSMLTAHRHDDVKVCGPSQLCGPVFFDMSALKAVSTNVNVVSIIHPYCDIQGLRWCVTASADTLGGFELGVALANRMPVINNWPAVSIQAERIYTESRNYIRTQAMKAPFWREGGILYLHILLPHPTGEGAARSLKWEYATNVKAAGALLRELAMELLLRFPGDHALLVTADHPLRTKMWCRNSVYLSPTCESENSEEGDVVPFIVWAPERIKVTLPSSNVGIWTRKNSK